MEPKATLTYPAPQVEHDRVYRSIAQAASSSSLRGDGQRPALGERAVQAVTGWCFTPDRQWLAKLLGLALGSQAWVAWSLRNEPHLGVANALAFYQLTSATSDLVMWIWLAEDGIFSAGTSIVVRAITTHYMLGLLLVRAIRGSSTMPARRLPPGERAGHEPETSALDCGRGLAPATSHCCDGRSFWHAAEWVYWTGPSRGRYAWHLARPTPGSPASTRRA
jgi:hypothetical protein